MIIIIDMIHIDIDVKVDSSIKARRKGINGAQT